MNRVLCIVAWALVVGIASLSEAATYWVSPTGAAAWGSCTGSTPLSGASACTPTTAMANAVAGDLVYFRSGTYEPGAGTNYETPAWSPTNSGTAGNYITFMAYPGETVTVHDASNSTAATNPSFGALNRNYIIWDGFTCVRNYSASGATQMVSLSGSSYIYIRNMTFSGSTTWTDTQNNAFIMLQGGGHHVYIHNNQFTALRGASVLANTASVWIMDDWNDIYVYNNDFLSGNGGVWWKTGPENNVYVYQNFFYDTRSIAVKPHSALGAGVEYSPRSGQFYIHHNVAVNADTFVYSADGTGNSAWRSEDLQVYQNTAYWSTAPSSVGGFLQHGDSGYQTNLNTLVYNNIVYVTNAGRFLETWDSINTSNRPATLDYNDYYNAAGTTSGTFNDSGTTVSGLTNWRTRLTTTEAWGTTARETNSINSDPLFMSTGGTTAVSYKLQAGSPALATGQGGVDMGAYEGNPCIGNDTCSVGTQRFSPMFNLRRAESGEIQVVSR